ncbi:MAG: 2-dehydro-3-deoxy-6-phosphogalactonate aldolase [Sphingomicrobium sp.]
MDGRTLLVKYLDQCPLIAILRGVRPDEVDAIGDALREAGIRIVEVPLNSPDPLRSIERLASRFGDDLLVGGGTVFTPANVEDIHAAGGRIIVSPHGNPNVIRATVQAGMVSCPGYFTPTEAFAALDAGANALKLFPAEAASPDVLKAHLAVIPKDVPMIVVGGVKPGQTRPWRDCGAAGFGLGGALYTAGQSAAETLVKARAFVTGLDA